MSKHEQAIREVIETDQTITQVARKHNLYKATLAKHVREYLNIKSVDDVIRWCDQPCVRDTRKIISAACSSTLHIWNDIIGRTTFLPKSATLRERLYYIKHNATEPPKCECGEFVSWSNTNQQFNQYCNSACSAAILHSNSKRIATNLRVRGVAHPYLAPDVRAKRDATMIERYGNTSFNKSLLNDEAVSVLTNRRLLEYMYNEHQSTFGVAQVLGVSQSHVSVQMDRFGLDAKQSGSAFEDGVMSYISDELGVACRKDRTILAPKEIDIYIPSHNIGIECNGVFWHSERYKHPKYHLEKTKAGAAAGVRIIHIFENEYISKPEIVKSRLSSVLGMNVSVGARLCTVREVSFSDAVAFFDQTHIQGSCRAMSTILGLYHDNQLIACMCFAKSRFTKSVDFELVRYSSKLFTNVVGGASRLFKQFCKMHPRSSIVSYSDVRWNSGTLYQTLGFAFSHTSNPNYFYFKDGNTSTLMSRVQFQKHKLSAALRVYDDSKSEYENMKANGYERIWDCGNTVWIYNP